jgi:hypothetical protein
MELMCGHSSVASIRLHIFLILATDLLISNSLLYFFFLICACALDGVSESWSCSDGELMYHCESVVMLGESKHVIWPGNYFIGCSLLKLCVALVVNVLRQVG